MEGSEGIEKSPSPRAPESKRAFFEKLRKCIIHCNTQQRYEDEAMELFGRVPLSGVALSIKFVRQGLIPVGYLDPRILVNDEYYSQRFGDYTEMLTFDLEHEMWEAFYAVKKRI